MTLQKKSFMKKEDCVTNFLLVDYPNIWSAPVLLLSGGKYLENWFHQSGQRIKGIVRLQKALLLLRGNKPRLR